MSGGGLLLALLALPGHLLVVTTKRGVVWHSTQSPSWLAYSDTVLADSPIQSLGAPWSAESRMPSGVSLSTCVAAR